MKYLRLVAQFFALSIITVFSPLTDANSALAGEILGSVHTIQSKILNEERTVWIYAPDGYATSDQKYPVFYVTDAEEDYFHVVSTTRFLSRLGKMPEMIVVGITNTDRARDLTMPISEKMIARNGESFSEQMPTAGGADQFFEFFDKELFPYVEANYPTAPYKMLAGHSLGGLFAVHGFVNHNDLFQSYIAASPPIYFNFGSLVDQAKTFLAENEGQKASLFLAMGNEGEVMLAPFDDLIEVLEQHRSDDLLWGSSHMTDERHMSTPLKAYYQGLEKMFDGWEVPPQTLEYGSLNDFKTHYANLSRRMGFEIKVPEGLVNWLGNRMRIYESAKDAIPIFTYNVELYPNSPDTYFYLGYTLETDGQLAAAQSNFKKAVEVAKENNSPNLLSYETKLKEISMKIKNEDK